jgi:alcohol oxidase
MNPASRGYVHTTSATDIYAPPEFDSGMLSDPIDLPPQIWAYKKNREIIRRMHSFRGEWAPSQPNFPKGTKAGIIEYDPNVKVEELTDLVYSKEDDEAIEKWIRDQVLSMCHPM